MSIYVKRLNMKKILNVNRYKHIYSCTGLPRCLSGEEPPCQCRRCKRCGFSSVLGGCPGGGHGNWLQYSCLESSLGRGTWWATVHGITKSQTWLSDWMHRHRHTHTHTHIHRHTHTSKSHSLQCDSHFYWICQFPYFYMDIIWKRKAM